MRYSCNYLLYGQAVYDKDNTTKRGIFKGPIGEMIETILNLTNEGSHMGEDYKTEGLYFSITSYALQLCDILCWFGKYIKVNYCISYNQLMDKYKGKEFIVSKDINGNYHCEECILPQAASHYLNKKVILENVIRNSSSSKKYYPFFAKFKAK
jgi:hypothetical protein